MTVSTLIVQRPASIFLFFESDRLNEVFHVGRASQIGQECVAGHLLGEVLVAKYVFYCMPVFVGMAQLVQLSL